MDEHGAIQLAAAVENAYLRGETDYSMQPLVLYDLNDQAVGRVKEGDGVVFCCRRGEREIELTDAFTSQEYPHFDRNFLKDLDFAILTLYHEKFKELPVAFAPVRITSTLSEVIAKAGKTQFHCSESEKFAHVTFFFNGGNHHRFSAEEDLCIASPKGLAFEQVPELSLPSLAKELSKALRKGFDFIVANFANGDVIGHTSNNDAKIKCAEIVDQYLGQVVSEAIAQDYFVLVTADHGNLEEMLTSEGKPHVAHTSNPVPFIAIDARCPGKLSVDEGDLCDVAPTVLALMGLTPPAIMAGKSLVHGRQPQDPRKVILVILDGWGLGKADGTNPIHLAQTPHWDRLLSDYPHSRLHASGAAVGLQVGKPGNSEAGHMNLGAGRMIPQDDLRLDQAMQDGTFLRNEVFLRIIEGVMRRGKSLHLIGLLSEKSSHGSIEYPLAILRIARQQGLHDVYLHLVFDGRSTDPGSAPLLLGKLEKLIAEVGTGKVVSGVGRGLALDRDGNYGKIRQAYEALTLGKGVPYR